MQKKIVLGILGLIGVVIFGLAYLLYTSSADYSENTQVSTPKVGKFENKNEIIRRSNDGQPSSETPETKAFAENNGSTATSESVKENNKTENLENTQEPIKQGEKQVLIKPIGEMTENELVDQLLPQNEPAYLIEIVNRIGALKKISALTIDQLLAFIGKKNADVDAYIVKALSINAVESEKVLLDLIVILRTNKNQVVRRCAADAIGEFKSAITKIKDLENLQSTEIDERVKLKLSKSIQKINLNEKRK